MKKLSILCIVLLLSGCGTITKLNNVLFSVDTPPVKIANPRAMTMKKVEWKVLTKEKLEELLKVAEETGQPVVLFATTPKGYENLSLNMAELKRYIKQLQQSIVYYKTVSEGKATPNSDSK